MTLFFISDTHFGHGNILNFQNADGSYVRPFHSTEEMDEHIIEKWNEVVRPQDHIWHLGDVTMKPALYLKHIKRLNGHKRLVMGNHDSGTVQQYLAAGFQKIASYRVYDNFLFGHIPVHPASLGRFTAMAHGHTHGNDIPDARYVNVCVERTDYQPISFEDIQYRYGQQRLSSPLQRTPPGEVQDLCGTAACEA